MNKNNDGSFPLVFLLSEVLVFILRRCQFVSVSLKFVQVYWILSFIICLFRNCGDEQLRVFF